MASFIFWLEQKASIDRIIEKLNIKKRGFAISAKPPKIATLIFNNFNFDSALKRSDDVELFLFIHKITRVIVNNELG